MEKKAKEKGFTLVEVMIVVAIIGVLAAVAVPNVLTWLSNVRLKAAARDVYSNMQRTRMEAVKENQNRAIVFDSANNSYSICSSSGADADWSTLADNTVEQAYVLTQYKSGVGYGSGSIVGNNSADTTPNAIEADNVSYTSNVLILNSRGTGSGGYIYLQNQDNAVFAIGTQTSGLIVLRRWMGGGWQ